jgi:hypothetical protein
MCERRTRWRQIDRAFVDHHKNHEHADGGAVAKYAPVPTAPRSNGCSGGATSSDQRMRDTRRASRPAPEATRRAAPQDGIALALTLRWFDQRDVMWCRELLQGYRI